jgi:hypothetical protein
MNRRLLLAAALSAAPPVLAQAQGVHGRGGGHARGPNGGQIQDLGGTHAEMVARDGEIRLWVLDARTGPRASKAPPDRRSSWRRAGSRRCGWSPGRATPT